MLRASGLCSGYDGVTVIKGIDLEVENEVFAVLGANGAGKTTLLATLARLIPMMSGELMVERRPSLARYMLRMQAISPSSLVGDLSTIEP